MSNTGKKSSHKPKVHKKSEFKLKKDPKSGILMLFGPDFTKVDIEKAYPENLDDRVAILMRRSLIFLDQIGVVDVLQKLYSRRS